MTTNIPKKQSTTTTNFNAPPPEDGLQQLSQHPTYLFPVLYLPPHINSNLLAIPVIPGKPITSYPDLHLVHFQPYVPHFLSIPLFTFLRSSLLSYCVRYKIKREGIETGINTPRYTTVFGVDSTSLFTPSGTLIDSITQKPILADRYRPCQPRPITSCLDELRKITEKATGTKYDFCLVNYYASGADSISYHSDDERFLGPEPSVASLSLGARRDFCMKHKPEPPQTASNQESEKPHKLPLASGDMVLMRGITQSKWSHSIPKRTGKGSEGGRINITFRKALERGGTENYYCYNGEWRGLEVG